MNDAPDRDVTVFTEALRLRAAERPGYLDRACAADAELRRRVEALLSAFEKAAEGDFLGEPAPGVPQSQGEGIAIGEKPGDRIGRYKLLQQIGEGGCGVVFMAEQEEPVRRRVAVKVVKPGMDTKSVMARFEAERQALALMDHPNIAHVFDAGATESGRPYFVMELVRGIKITEFCDQHNLTTAARLDLFMQVCRAVQHAHQKGIIHRDIKPTNVLVTMSDDGKPLPMVIDFGIAKATTGQRLTDKTVFTAFEMLIGTPAYMSPEQADLTSADVDTRSDIYSLGVLLYELLVGATPFDSRELLKAGLDEVRRVIREQEPVRPSTRLSTMLAADLTGVSLHRQVEPPRLIREVRGDLDWIVMTALEKDRGRRYQTANSLAEDIHHYLKNETVSARPPSRLYKFGKLVSRHKLWFGALGVVLATLVAGLSVTTWSLTKEKRARRDAESARGEANDQRKKAETGEQKALTEVARSQQTQKFMNDMLLGVSPWVAKGRDTTVLREILDKAAERVDRELTNQPEVQADLKYTIGKAYGTLGLLDKEEPLLRAALATYRKTPGMEQKIADTLSRLSLMHIELIPPKPREAEPDAREALAIVTKLRGEENMQVVALKSRLGRVLQTRGKVAEAESCLREALALGLRLGADKSDEVLDARNGLARALVIQRKPAEAEPLLIESLSVMQEKYGSNDLGTANCLYLLALACEAQAKRDQAEALYRECLAIRRNLVSPDHPLLEGALSALGGVLQHQRKWKEAAGIYSELLELLRKRYGDKDDRLLNTIVSLARVLLADANEVQFEQLAEEFSVAWVVRAEGSARRGNWSEAAAAASKVVETRPADPGSYHLAAPLLVQTGDRAAYEALCAQMVARFASTTNPVIADRTARNCLILPGPGADLKIPGQLAETAVTLGSANQKALHIFQFCKALAEYRQGRWDGAALWAQRAVENPFPHTRAGSYAVLAMAQHQLGHGGNSRDTLKKCVEVVEKQLPKLEGGDLGPDWRDWIIAHALLTEAKSTIEGPAAASGKPEVK